MVSEAGAVLILGMAIIAGSTWNNDCQIRVFLGIQLESSKVVSVLSTSRLAGSLGGEALILGMTIIIGSTWNNDYQIRVFLGIHLELSKDESVLFTSGLAGSLEVALDGEPLILGKAVITGSTWKNDCQIMAFFRHSVRII